MVLALVIYFGNPEIPESKKSIKNNSTQNKIITDFPYQYFKEEVLTDGVVEFRIRLIYSSVLISIIGLFSVVSTVDTMVGKVYFLQQQHLSRD